MSPKESRAPEKYPDTEIVFDAGDVGFVNSDGSNLSYFPLTLKEPSPNRSRYWTRPVLTADGNSLIFKLAAFYIQDPQKLAVIRPGGFPIICSEWGKQLRPQLNDSQSDLYINVGQDMETVAINDCGTAVTGQSVVKGIVGFPSPNGQYIAHVKSPDRKQPFIFLHVVKTGNDIQIAIGDFPVWSRDNERLAYTGEDGLYVVSIDNLSKVEKIMEYRDKTDPKDPAYSSNRGGFYVPPEVSWSPDGKWLIYHRYIANGLGSESPNDHAIFKVNIETGEETLVVEGGMYPFWRWPIEDK